MREFTANEVHAEMSAIFLDVYNRYGSKNSESLYQKACMRCAYLKGFPVMSERELYVDYGDGNFLIGRVDLEVAGLCLYELKIGAPNVSKDGSQIRKYLMAYDRNTENIQIACLVYFTNSGVVFHEVRSITN